MISNVNTLLCVVCRGEAGRGSGTVRANQFSYLHGAVRVGASH